MNKRHPQTLDSICQSYKNSLRGGESPQLADFLDRLENQSHRRELLERLLRIEAFELRETASEKPTKRFLKSEHIELQDEIRPLVLGGLSDDEPIREGVIDGLIVEDWEEITENRYRVLCWDETSHCGSVIHLFIPDDDKWHENVGRKLESLDHPGLNRVQKTGLYRHFAYYRLSLETGNFRCVAYKSPIHFSYAIRVIVDLCNAIQAILDTNLSVAQISNDGLLVFDGDPRQIESSILFEGFEHVVEGPGQNALLRDLSNVLLWMISKSESADSPRLTEFQNAAVFETAVTSLSRHSRSLARFYTTHLHPSLGTCAQSITDFRNQVESAASPKRANIRPVFLASVAALMAMALLAIAIRCIPIAKTEPEYADSEPRHELDPSSSATDQAINKPPEWVISLLKDQGKETKLAELNSAKIQPRLELLTTRKLRSPTSGYTELKPQIRFDVETGLDLPLQLQYRVFPRPWRTAKKPSQSGSVDGYYIAELERSDFRAPGPIMTRLVAPTSLSSSEFALGPFTHELSLKVSCREQLLAFQSDLLANAKTQSRSALAFSPAVAETHLRDFEPSSWTLSSRFVQDFQLVVRRIRVGATPESLNIDVSFVSSLSESTDVESEAILPIPTDAAEEFAKAIGELRQAPIIAYRIEWADGTWSDTVTANRLDPSGSVSIASVARKRILNRIKDGQPLLAFRSDLLTGPPSFCIVGLADVSIAISEFSYSDRRNDNNPFLYTVRHRDLNADDSFTAFQSPRSNIYRFPPPLTTDRYADFVGNAPDDSLPIPSFFSTVYISITFCDGTSLSDIELEGVNLTSGMMIPGLDPSLLSVFVFPTRPNWNSYYLLVRTSDEIKTVTLSSRSARAKSTSTEANFAVFRMIRGKLTNAYTLGLQGQSGEEIGIVDFQITPNQLREFIDSD